MDYVDMTDEEYDALDEELTRNPPAFGPNGTGWLSRRELHSIGLTKLSTEYLLTKAMANRKSPAQIIDEMVLERISAEA